MKLSLAPMAAAVEDTPLLPNAKKKGYTATDSKTTTTKKRYSVVRLSMAFGTFAFLLLGVVFFADRGGKINNNNIVHNTIRSSGKEKLHTKTSQAMREKPADCNLPRFKKGMCETTGTYNDVLPYLDHQKVIPGKIYYGLDFTDLSYYGKTSTPHTDYFDFDGIVRQSCLCVGTWSKCG